MNLEKNKVRIVFSNQEPGSLKLALQALIKDFVRVMETEPLIVEEIDKTNSHPEIVIVNRASGATKVSGENRKKLDGFESHRMYADSITNKIYLEGYDHRGTVYAIYAFSEKFLGVPPLHYWSSWVPVKTDVISIPDDYDLFFKSPQVRYRCLLLNDDDFMGPWRKISPEHDNIWLETALRLKLNTVEAYSTIKPGHKLTDFAYLISRYGLTLTSHHTSGLNTSFSSWTSYWTNERKMNPPELLLSNEQAILEFFRYNAETVQKSGIENLWTIAFRGAGDQPFWTIFKDAPEQEKDRAEVINKMLQIQYDLIKEVTGDQEPYVRITFYDELADLKAKGFLKPPAGKNMIWTYVAARRDPYPYDDIVKFKPGSPVKLGYYMNFGFASTGAHVAPAESPWKMEFNYRYVNSKSPLYFSVVNTGNMREFLLELSANAAMLWDYGAYATDEFMVHYCTQYFGEKYARDIVQLYKDFYNAYWEPKKSEFAGMDRQFVFQDLRYARAFDHVYDRFRSTQSTPDLNPLREIGYERIPGRSFRIDLKYNDADNHVDAILHGMLNTIPKFESVAARCSAIMAKLDNDKQTFFNDNLRMFTLYMAHLSKTLYHFLSAYKNQPDKEGRAKNLDQTYSEAVFAQQSLFEAQHGVFSTWYSGAIPLKATFQIDALIEKILLLKHQALP